VVSVPLLARLLAILVIWFLVAGLGTGFFFAPRGVEAQPVANDLIGFACSLALAGVVASAVAVGLAGRRRWTLEIALAVVLMAAAAAVLAYLALWVFPWTVRSRMDAWSFLGLRRDVPRWGQAIILFHAPMGAGVGSVVGVMAGLLILLARRRPRLATGIALGLLFACASSQVQRFVFGAVITFGRTIQWGWYVLSQLEPWAMTDDQIWSTAAVFGAIVGAVVASLAVRMSGPD
jgi:hypothetical protein